MTTLTYEDTLSAFLSFIGRPVSAIVGGLHNQPALIAVLEGTLERGTTSPAMERLYAHLNLPHGEHTVFLVGGSAYFALVRDDFEEANWVGDGLVARFTDFDLSVLPVEH